jgi:hypothetical protein
MKIELDTSVKNTFVIFADCEFGDGGDDGMQSLHFTCATLEEVEEIHGLNELLRHSSHSEGDKEIIDYIANCQNRKIVEEFLEDYPAKYEAGNCYFSNYGLDIHYYDDECRRHNVKV